MSTSSFVMSHDMSDFCRVCLLLPKKSQYLKLTKICDENHKFTFRECFAFYTQIDLNVADGLPSHLCKECGLEFKASYAFHKKFEESQRMIEQYQIQMNVQKSNDAELIKNNGLNNTEYIPHIIDEKFVVSNQQLLAPTQGIEENCLLPQNPKIKSNSDVNNEPDETDNINHIWATKSNICQDQWHENDSNMEALNDNVNSLEMEDYPNLDTFKEDDLPSFIFKEEYLQTEITVGEETIINTTITPCIPSGIRLPIPPGPPYICEFCGYSSNTKKLLSSHLNRKHLHKELSYRCDKCGKSFKYKDAYTEHMQRLSCQNYPEFNCEYCTKKIIGSENYKGHLRCHKKIYPIECQICGKGFMMAVHLKRHVETKHENKGYIFEETNCGKLFQSRQSLEAHMYLHSGSKPYCCEYCKKMISSRGRLRRHIKIAHDCDISSEDLDRMLVAAEINFESDVKTVELND